MPLKMWVDTIERGVAPGVAGDGSASGFLDGSATIRATVRRFDWAVDRLIEKMISEGGKAFQESFEQAEIVSMTIPQSKKRIEPMAEPITTRI
jgi:hypothetical protein